MPREPGARRIAPAAGAEREPGVLRGARGPRPSARRSRTPRRGSRAAGSTRLEGAPPASRFARTLTLKTLAGDEEQELDDGTTEVDFDVLFHDARVLTIATSVSTMGAYPSMHGNTVSFAWSTGRKLGAEVVRPGKRRELVKLLDGRVHDAWTAAKRTFAQRPTDESSCGPDVVSDFMHRDAPAFTPAMLDGIFVVERGIVFGFDFDVPHAVKACTPPLDLSLPWAQAQAFLDPKGVLGVAGKE